MLGTIAGSVINGATDAISSAVSKVLPSRTTVVVTATLGLTGAALGGLPGLALGVGLGIAISPIANGAVDAIYAGAGHVAQGIKAAYNSTIKLVKSTIYCALESLFGWVARWSESSSWVKEVYAKVNESYLNANAHLQSLFTPLPNGVAKQEHIIEVLIAQAKESGQNVTPDQIRSWVALGERLVQALGSAESNTEQDGRVIVVQDDKGNKVKVASSLYTIRTITWYVKAQALWHAAIREGDSTPSPEKMREITKANKDVTTFVVPDPNNKLFNFIQEAPSSYNDEGNLLNKKSGSKEVLTAQAGEDIQLRAINDVAKMLPNQNQGLVVNPLKAIGSGPKRLAIRLQKLPKLSLMEGGQRREGHESLAWRAIQRLTSGSKILMDTIAEWNPDKKIQIQTPQQSRHHEVHQTVINALKKAKVKPEDRKKALEKIQGMPLFSLLQLFKKDSDYAEKQPDLYKLFDQMSIADYNRIKNDIADKVELEARGDIEQVKAQEGDEVWVPTNLHTASEMKQYVERNKINLHAELTAYREPKQTIPQIIVAQFKIPQVIKGVFGNAVNYLWPASGSSTKINETKSDKDESLISIDQVRVQENKDAEVSTDIHPPLQEEAENQVSLSTELKTYRNNTPAVRTIVATRFTMEQAVSITKATVGVVGGVLGFLWSVPERFDKKMNEGIETDDDEEPRLF